MQVFLGGPSLAVVPMAVLMLLLHGACQWVGAAGGVVIYAALCYGLGCLSRDDLQMLRQAFAKKGRGIGQDDAKSESLKTALLLQSVPALKGQAKNAQSPAGAECR